MVMGMQESMNFCASYLTSFVLIWMEFGLLLRLVGVMSLILISSDHYSGK